jgi:hypothetical protein
LDDKAQPSQIAVNVGRLFDGHVWPGGGVLQSVNLMLPAHFWVDASARSWAARTRKTEPATSSDAHAVEFDVLTEPDPRQNQVGYCGGRARDAECVPYADARVGPRAL